MKKQIFKGAGVALVTPMNEDGSVNYNKLKEIIEFQIAGKTDALIICGTTGESPTLSDEEILKITEETVKQTACRVPVIVGTGSNDTAHSIELSLEVEKLGADGLLMVTPYYNKTTQKGLVKSYFAVADRVDLPIIVYHIPGRTGLTIAMKTFQELAEHPNIVAVKEASGNISIAAQLRALCGDSFALYSGNDDQVVPLLSIGGAGVISVLSNVAPKAVHDLCQLYFDGKVKESAEIQIQMMDLINALFHEVNPIPVKEAMNLMGMNVGSGRLPLCEPSEETVKMLKNSLEKHKLI